MHHYECICSSELSLEIDHGSFSLSAHFFIIVFPGYNHCFCFIFCALIIKSTPNLYQSSTFPLNVSGSETFSIHSILLVKFLYEPSDPRRAGLGCPLRLVPGTCRYPGISFPKRPGSCHRSLGSCISCLPLCYFLTVLVEHILR